MNRKEKRARKKKDKGIVDFFKITHHYFKDFGIWIEEMKDPRNQSYITYSQRNLIYEGILKNICGVESMRQMDEKFNEEVCIDTLGLISGNQVLEEMPHYDTLNYYLERLSPCELDTVRSKMINTLIRGKQFYANRLNGRYWRIILDGTGLFYFKNRHCENCLSETRKDAEGHTATRYYHKVVEAKLVLRDDLVISLGTEFIENENENVSKQDCEIRAAERLMERIKRMYPRLPICIHGDALYAAESVMERCRKNGWSYIFTQKATRQKVASESYEWIVAGGWKTEVRGIGAEKGVGGYVNHVEEVSGKTEVMNIFEYKCRKNEKELQFQWVTNIEVTEKNLESMVHAGRGRWKIENEGFNNQKNGIYQISHMNSRNSTAMKNHYLLTQIADIMMQLYLVWNPLIEEIKQSIKNTSSRLLESFRRQTVTDEDVLYIQKHTSVYLI